MSISSRIHDTIEGWQAEWKDRLRGWMGSWVQNGLVSLIEFLEPEGIDLVRTSLSRITDLPDTPQDVKDIAGKLTAGTKPLPLLVLIPLAVLMFIPMITAIFQPIGNLLKYAQERIFHSWRLNPIEIITAWRRDPEKYAGLFDDLTQQGWNDERIEALKFLTLFYPAPADLVRWQAREVFEPAMIEKYGLDDELGGIQRDPFYKAGMTDEQITNYWRAHWEHASWMQVVEMLHRGLVTEAEVWDWFRVVEIIPYWRQHLIDTAYTWPTRVDVRRWWDMRTIDEARLRELYSGMGYRGKNLDDYVLWTKVYVAFPDLMARWGKGWIALEDVRTELTALGMPAARLEEFIQMKVKAAEPERIEKERDITKTDIIKGVRTAVITRGEGVELLEDMGYDYDEAVYILEINIPVDEEEAVVKQRLLSKADIRAGLAKEVISEDEARAMLLEMRYSPADVEFLLDIYQVVAKPPPEPRIREASKADIVLGVKKGLISQEEGYGMLLDLDFTAEAASFILTVKTEESPFSPINYAEFKDLTSKYRRATGREAVPMSEVLKSAAAEVVRITGDIEALNRAITEEKAGLIEGEELPPAATARLTELEVSRNRAESELMRAKIEYDRLIAEWRQQSAQA